MTTKIECSRCPVTSSVVLNPNELHNNIYLPSGEEKKMWKHKHKNGCTSGAGTANPSGAPEFTAGF